MHSHFHVQPNYSVEVVLFCVVVGVGVVRTSNISIIKLGLLAEAQA